MVSRGRPKTEILYHEIWHLELETDAQICSLLNFGCMAAGLSRTGKSCRLRWMNYLRPDVKRGPFTLEEVDIVIKMYQEFGSRWSAIAAKLPGRTDNEVKNFFHTHLKKHFGLKNRDTQLKTRKSRKQTKENEKKNSTRGRAVVGTINNSSSLSTDVCSPCSSIITCEENQMIVSNTNIGVAEGLEYSQQCSIPDGSTYEQFDMNSFWFDILENF